MLYMPPHCYLADVSVEEELPRTEIEGSNNGYPRRVTRDRGQLVIRIAGDLNEIKRYAEILKLHPFGGPR